MNNRVNSELSILYTFQNKPRALPGFWRSPKSVWHALLNKGVCLSEAVSHATESVPTMWVMVEFLGDARQSERLC